MSNINTPSTIDTNEFSSNEQNEISAWTLFVIFLKIGFLSFGGFMALISVIENIMVYQRKLIKHQEMLDGISLANLLPGPMAVNLVAFTGYRLRGAFGAFLSVVGVVLPSFILIICLSILYFDYGNIIGVKNAFQGFMPAIAAIVLSVVWRMGKNTITSNISVIIATTAAVILFTIPQAYLIYSPLIIFSIAAVVGANYLKSNKVQIYLTSTKTSKKNSYLPILLLLSLLAFWFIQTPQSNTLVLLTLTFASMSLILFGGGYVFIPIIGSIVVSQYGWLSQQEFTDGIAMGQVTPGPILISAAFIGYKVAGITGAVLSTFAIFTPPAILMVTMSNLLDKLNNSPKTQAAIRGIHCAVIGMIYIAALLILQSAFSSSYATPWWPTLLIFILSLLGLIKFKLDIIWIIPAAGLAGFLFY